MTPRPDYKSHPLWNEAMALAREAYLLADRIAASDPEGARALRRSAVSVPARLAGALSSEEAESREELFAALGSLAQVARRAAAAGAAGEPFLAGNLARRVEDLDRAVLAAFEGPLRGHVS
jgi:hypothetical protein